MRKSDKKLENEIIRCLTDVCEVMKPELEGFIWLNLLSFFLPFKPRYGLF